MLTNRRRIGLAVNEQGLTAVELAAGPRSRAVLHTAALAFGKELNLDEPEKLGKELRSVLRRRGFGASRCVIGLGAGLLACREKLLPPTDPESLRNALNIIAEREFASGAQELAFDYCRHAADTGLGVLLMAAPRRLLAQLATMAAAAHLDIVAVTSSTAAVALATNGAVSPSGRLVLSLLPGGVELAVQSPGGLHLVRRLAARVDSSGQSDGLGGELRRLLALAGGAMADQREPAAAPAQGEPTGGRELLIWDAVGVDADALRELGRQLGLRTRLCSLESDLAPADLAAAPEGGKLVQAAACGALTPPVDFLHSRLAEPRKSRLGRRALWAIAAAAVVLGLLAYLLLDWQMAQQDVLALQGQMAAIKGGTDQARQMLDDLSFVGAWYDHRPRFLDCVHEVTQAFPDEGRTWATRLVIHEDMHAVLTGKAVSESAAMDVLDRLKSNPRLANVKPQYISQSQGGSAREWSFEVSLSLRGAR